MTLTNPLVILLLGGVGTIVSVLWNLWLTAERKAAKIAHEAMEKRVEALEKYVAKLETDLDKRLTRIEDKLDRVLEHRG